MADATPWNEFLTAQRAALDARCQAQTGFPLDTLSAPRAVQSLDYTLEPNGPAEEWAAARGALVHGHTHLLVGPPGQGKSVLAWREIAHRTDAFPEGPVPIYLDAAQLVVPAAPEQVVESLAQAIAAHFPGGPQAVVEALLSTRALLVVDGLDALEDGPREAIIKGLGWLDGGATIWLLGDPNALRDVPAPGGARHQLLDLDDAAREAIAATYLGDHAALEAAFGGALGPILRSPGALALAARQVAKGEALPDSPLAWAQALVDDAEALWAVYRADPGAAAYAELPTAVRAGLARDEGRAVVINRGLLELAVAPVCAAALDPSLVADAGAHLVLGLALQLAKDGVDGVVAALAEQPPGRGPAELALAALSAPNLGDPAPAWSVVAAGLEAIRRDLLEVPWDTLRDDSLVTGALALAQASDLAAVARHRKRRRRGRPVDVEAALEAHVGSDNPALRWIAVYLAGATRKGAGLLSSRLADPHPAVAALAAIALARADAAQAEATLVPLLSEADAAVPQDALIEALGEVARPDAFEALCARLLQPEPPVRLLGAIARSVVRAKKPTALRTRDGLLALVRPIADSADPYLRAMSARARGKLHDAEAWPLLAADARTPGRDPTRQAARLAAMRACADLVGQLEKVHLDYATALFVPALKDPATGNAVRRAAAEGLTRLAPRNPRWADAEVDAALALETHRDAPVARAAQVALDRLPDSLLDAAVARVDRDELAARLRTKKEGRFARRLAARILAEGPEDAVPQATALLTDWLRSAKPDPAVGQRLTPLAVARFEGAPFTAPGQGLLEALTRHDGGRPIPALATLGRAHLPDPAAIAFLGKAGDSDALAALQRLIFDPPDAETEAAATQAFGALAKRLKGVPQKRKGRGRRRGRGRSSKA